MRQLTSRHTTGKPLLNLDVCAPSLKSVGGDRDLGDRRDLVARHARVPDALAAVPPDALRVEVLPEPAAREEDREALLRRIADDEVHVSQTCGSEQVNIPESDYVYNY